MIRITTRQLEYLTAIADSRTLTEAAERCFVSQAALSTALGQLESALGLSLVIRRQASRQISLTREGQTIASRARIICQELEDLSQFATLTSEQIAGEIRIGCFSPLSPVVLPSLLQYFTEHHPDLRIQTLEGAPHELEQSLVTGALDAVLAYSRHLSPGFHLEKLATTRLFALLPATHPHATRDSITFPELEGENLILLDMVPISSLVPGLLEQYNVSPIPTYRSSNVETVRALVARGLGYSVMAIPPLDHGSESHRTVAIPIRSDYPRGHMIIAMNSGTNISARMREVVIQCRRIFAEYEGLSLDG